MAYTKMNAGAVLLKIENTRKTVTVFLSVDNDYTLLINSLAVWRMCKFGKILPIRADHLLFPAFI